MTQNARRKTQNDMTRNRERGAVLLLTFIVMIALVTITAGFLYMLSARARSVAYAKNSEKAFWLAEAGLQQVMYRLKNDSVFSDNPTTVTGNLGDGSYSVTVSMDESTYTITSTGTTG